ncbi:MAG: preprotein translocase subunit TatA [Candidatus Schekmanbacteria bacterium RBG_13_48_7]|uniref:Sec-independent protein translocase protein TatA n=1 Tax=Candidatus Schekmanbacteria bacterium RBG_13_48_7 TaxID=1817878 RepID=A0A1F7RU59_9BACT|nr:MAG: preprotein translocase subunit TatA [Candidatus Schekmanbacteria bacterium RBG_13_48_7]
MFGGLGLPELIVILFIIMIVFGVGKLPEIGRGLGEGIKSFKKATREDDSIPKKISEGETKNSGNEIKENNS